MKRKQVLNRTIMREEHKQVRTQGKAYIDCNQRKQLSRELGDSATVLYHHYFDKAAYKNFDILDDKATARTIGWSLRKVQRERLRLMHSQWIYKHVFNDRTGSHHITILGQPLVIAYLAAETLDLVKDSNTTMTVAEKLLGDNPGKLLIKKEK